MDSNPRPSAPPRPERRAIRRVGVLPRALRYFLLLSVVLHGSLIFVGRQFAAAPSKLAKPSPRPENRADRVAMNQAASRRDAPAAASAASEQKPFRLDFAALKTYRSHVSGYTARLLRRRPR